MDRTLEQLEHKADLFLKNGIVKTELWNEIALKLSQHMDYLVQDMSPDVMSEIQGVIDRREEEFKDKFRDVLIDMPSFPVARMIFCLEMISVLASKEPQTLEEYNDIFSFWEICNAAMQVYIEKYFELFDGANDTLDRDFSEKSVREESGVFVRQCSIMKEKLLAGEPWESIFPEYIRTLHNYENLLVSLI